MDVCIGVNVSCIIIFRFFTVTAAKHGVLMRGSSVVESLSYVDQIAVDKTGTLTKGFFKLNHSLFLTANGGSNSSNDRDFDPLLLAASLESKSTHPLASAVGVWMTFCLILSMCGYS